MTLYELNDCNFLSANIQINVVDTANDYDVVDRYEEKDSEDIWGIIDEDKYPNADDYDVLSISTEVKNNSAWIIIDVELPMDEEDR